jgi:hypothetical protein
MNETNNAVLELWQRSAVRLAVILSCTLPKDAVEFLDLREEVTETLDTLTDLGQDDRLFSDPRMQVLMGEELLALLSSVPTSVAYAEVRCWADTNDPAAQSA